MAPARATTSLLWIAGLASPRPSASTGRVGLLLLTSEGACSNGQSPPRRPASSPEGLRLYGGEPDLGREAGRKVPARSPAVGGDPAALAGAGTGGRLAVAEGDRACRRIPRDAEDPRARGRDLLHDVPALPGRKEGARAGVRHDAMPVARRGRAVRGVCTQDSSPAVSRLGRRQLFVGRGRVPGRLRERPDGADLERYLRGPDREEFR